MHVMNVVEILDGCGIMHAKRILIFHIPRIKRKLQYANFGPLPLLTCAHNAGLCYVLNQSRKSGVAYDTMI